VQIRLIWLGWGFCEHGNEPSGSIRDEGFLNPSTLEHLILLKYPADGGDFGLNVEKLHACSLKIVTHKN
jgi:hypothetical protein